MLSLSKMIFSNVNYCNYFLQSIVCFLFNEHKYFLPTYSPSFLNVLSQEETNNCIHANEHTIYQCPSKSHTSPSSNHTSCIQLWTSSLFWFGPKTDDHSSSHVSDFKMSIDDHD